MYDTKWLKSTMPKLKIHEPIFDYMRAIAVCAVVALHTSAIVVVKYISNPDSFGWWTGNVVNSMVRWCVPVFVMLSGALLLDPSKSETATEFFRKRINRILIPLVFWSLVYIILAWVFHSMQSGFNFIELLRRLVTGLLSGRPHYHLWFLFMIIGLYAITPILRLILKRFHSYCLYIGLGCLALTVYATGMQWTENIIIMARKIFATQFIEFIGYFILGSALFHNLRKQKTLWPFIALALLSMFTTAHGTYNQIINNHPVPFYFYSYNSPFVAVMVVSIFIVFCGLRDTLKVNKMITVLSDNSLGIYIIHAALLDIITQSMYRLCVMIHPVLFIPTAVVLLIALSVCISIGIRKIPIMRKVV